MKLIRGLRISYERGLLLFFCTIEVPPNRVARVFSSGPQTRALRDKRDREDFLQRLAVLCQEGNLIVYAVQRRSCRR
jgi:hypothetical protein